MKVFRFVKDVFIANKVYLLVSFILILFGCFIIYSKFKSPLGYTISIGLASMFVLMYFFAFLFDWGNYE
ncbi:MAG TPA: hypothetical protein VMZ91_15985 [Candidatus Paceibacterota bacterium]|nr:hypothetical protein [Candidatus Paceibacterota bacterium]